MKRSPSKTQCSVEWCDRPSRARSMCTKHYQQMKLWGEVRPDREKFSVCQADGCERKPRSESASYCEMHYSRLRRNGTLSIVAPRVPDSKCVVVGCNKKAFTTGGLCRNHSLGMKRNGDFKNHARGELAYNWVSESELGYKTAHRRVKTARGSASKYPCVDCGKKARHWSYNHCAEHELSETHERGGVVSYSANIWDYSPRCVSCHKKFDLNTIEAKGGK